MKTLGKNYPKLKVQSCATQYFPLECNIVTYEYSVSSLIYPSMIVYYNWCIDMPSTCDSSLSYDDFRTRYIVINVYYSSLTYTQMLEMPTMTFAGLLASIGGSMSFIVGISCFTIFEIVELSVLFMHALCKSYSNKVQDEGIRA